MAASALQTEFVKFVFSSDTWRKKIVIGNHPSGGSLKIFVEFIKDNCKEIYSSVTLQTFGLQIEMILKLLARKSFTGIFLRFSYVLMA